MADIIPPEFENFIRQEIASGKYQSEGDVIGEGLRLLQQRQRRLEFLRKQVQIGRDELDRDEGIVVELNGLREFFDQIVGEADKTLAAKKSPAE